MSPIFRQNRTLVNIIAAACSLTVPISESTDGQYVDYLKNTIVFLFHFMSYKYHAVHVKLSYQTLEACAAT